MRNYKNDKQDKPIGGMTVIVRNDDVNKAMRIFKKKVAEAGIIPTLKIDGALSAGGVSLHLIHELEKLQPYGSGNAEPRFIIPNARIASADVAGMEHLRFSLDNPGGYQTRGIAFRCIGSPLGDALLNHNGKPFHLVGRVKINRWQGRSYPQFQLDDAAPVW